MTSGLEPDFHPRDNASVFNIDAPCICCSAKLCGIRTNSIVKAQWVCLQEGMAKKENPLLREETLECNNDGYIGFTLPAPVSGFITGDYEITISIDGKQGASKPFSIQKDTSVPLPTISSFSVTPASIISGQTVTLRWKVLNASRIVIEPSVGTVPPEDSKELSPPSDITYTIWAFSRRGSCSNSQSVKVAAATTAKPDLVITEFWSSGNVISYRIKNAGDGASCETQTFLYKNGIVEDRDYVAPLTPGEERSEAFLTYHFSPRFSFTGIGDPAFDSLNITLCADGDNACVESKKDNNCFEHNYGMLTKLNFCRYASTAQWECSSGHLKWPMYKGSKEGWVTISSSADVLQMCPPAEKNGWVQGIFGISSGNPPVLKPITIPHKSSFSARVGLTHEVPASSNVIFSFGIVRDSQISFFQPITITGGDKTENYQIDFSEFADQQVKFIFRVESDGPIQPGSATWAEPFLIQEG